MVPSAMKRSSAACKLSCTSFDAFSVRGRRVKFKLFCDDDGYLIHVSSDVYVTFYKQGKRHSSSSTEKREMSGAKQSTKQLG